MYNFIYDLKHVFSCIKSFMQSALGVIHTCKHMYMYMYVRLQFPYMKFTLCVCIIAYEVYVPTVYRVIFPSLKARFFFL